MENIPKTELLTFLQEWRICIVRNLPETGETFIKTLASRHGLSITRHEQAIICVMRVDDITVFEEFLERAKNYWPQIEITFDNLPIEEIALTSKKIRVHVLNAVYNAGTADTAHTTEIALLFEDIEDQEAGAREYRNNPLTIPPTACKYTLPANTVVLSQHTGLFVRLKTPLTVRIEERGDGSRDNDRVATFTMVGGVYHLLVKGHFRNDMV